MKFLLNLADLLTFSFIVTLIMLLLWGVPEGEHNRVLLERGCELELQQGEAGQECLMLFERGGLEALGKVKGG